MAALIDNFKEPDEDQCDMCNCDLKTRLIGGILTMAIGAFLSFISFVPFSRREMPTFSIAYVIGSCCALGSTFFFAGWKKQMKALTSNMPLLCSLIAIIVSMILIVVCGNLTTGTLSVILVILFLACQWIAQIFYAITAIPGGWTAVKGVFSACC